MNLTPETFKDICVTIWGNSQCHKSIHASTLAKAFGKENIVAIEDMHEDDLPSFNTLYFTAKSNSFFGVLFSFQRVLELPNVSNFLLKSNTLIDALEKVVEHCANMEERGSEFDCQVSQDKVIEARVTLQRYIADLEWTRNGLKPITNS